MKIIIIAAGSSTRLSKEILDIPKGLSKINDKSIIEIQLDLFKKNNLSDITIIVGPNKEKFKFRNVDYITDRDFQSHDVLGSLMVCKSIIDDEVLTSYSDIIFDQNILNSMLDFKGDIGIAVDCIPTPNPAIILVAEPVIDCSDTDLTGVVPVPV